MLRTFILITAASALGSVVWAQAPSDAPAGATGLCNDGSYWSSPTKRGACSGHQGIKNWYGAAASSNAPATVPKGVAPSGDGAAMPAQPVAATNSATPGAPATVPKVKPSSGQSTQTAPGTTGSASAPMPGSPAAPATVPKVSGSDQSGMVWVNSGTKVYHCKGDARYGKTQEGSYMSESDAVAQGNHADHGKLCH